MAKTLLKVVFILVVLLLLVLMGMHNKSNVDFVLPPLLNKSVKMPSAIMYFAFFSIGVITATVLMSGGGGKPASNSSKPAKK